MVMVMVVVMAPSAVRAESGEAQVERLAADAVNAYKGADYNRAVELLTRAYEIRQVPALLYNMAKAYDKLGDVDHAADAYRRYADSADAEPKLKVKAEARLTVLEEAKRKKAAAARAAAPPPPEPRVVAPAPPVRPAERAPAAAPPLNADDIRDQLHADRVRARRHDRYVALGVGSGAVALAAVGVGLAASAQSLQSQFGQTLDADRKKQLKSDAQRQAAVADGFFAGTVVVAAVTAYFLYRGFRPEPTAPSLALSVSPAGAGFVVAGRF